MPKPWNRINIPKEILEDLYENQRLSIAQIASNLGYSTRPIHRLLKEYHLKIRSISEAKEKFKISKQELINLYYTQRLSTDQIARKYGCSHVTIVNRMKKFGIKSRGHLGLTKPIRISKEKLEYLYHTRDLSATKIAKIIHKSKGGVERKIKQFGVKTRGVANRACKYKKRDFSGDLIEKAYMIGFRLGDLNVMPTGNLIQARCSTTKRAQIMLIKNLFSSYTTPHIWKAKRGTWEIVALLNRNFEFLLPNKDQIESWILNNPQYFWAFFAGYADAEGSFYIRKSLGGKRRPFALFEIQTQQKQIIHQLWSKLTEFGISSPKPKISRRAGTIDKRGRKNNQNMWRIEVCQKESLWKLLHFSKHYIKHLKKITEIQKLIENIIYRNNLPYSHPIDLTVPKLN